MNDFNIWMRMSTKSYYFITNIKNNFGGDSYFGWEYQLDPETEKTSVNHDYFRNPKSCISVFGDHDVDLAQYEKESMIYSLFYALDDREI